MRFRFLIFLLIFIICAPVYADDFNIVAPQEIHELDLDTPVQMTGIVIVDPGVLGPQFFYINGAQIYSYYKDFPNLHIGDKITVKGVISQSRGEKRVKIKVKNDIVVLHPNYSVPTPIVKGVNEIDNSLIGQLITIKGRVIERTRQRIFIDNGGIEETVVYIKQYTDIDKSEISEGDSIEVTGVVSQSGDEVRILPRSNNDITITTGSDPVVDPKIDYAGLNSAISKEMTASAGQVVEFNTIKPYFIISSIILGLIFILLLKKERELDI